MVIRKAFGRRLRLLDFLRSSYTWPILRDEEVNYGFLHRLDVPSSGLILTAKSYEAYWSLRLQRLGPS